MFLPVQLNQTISSKTIGFGESSRVVVELCSVAQRGCAGAPTRTRPAGEAGLAALRLALVSNAPSSDAGAAGRPVCSAAVFKH